MVCCRLGVHPEIDDETRHLQHRTEDPPAAGGADTEPRDAVAGTTTGHMFCQSALARPDRVRLPGTRINHNTPLFIRMPVPGRHSGCQTSTASCRQRGDVALAIGGGNVGRRRSTTGFHRLTIEPPRIGSLQGLGQDFEIGGIGVSEKRFSAAFREPPRGSVRLSCRAGLNRYTAIRDIESRDDARPAASHVAGRQKAARALCIGNDGVGRSRRCSKSSGPAAASCSRVSARRPRGSLGMSPSGGRPAAAHPAARSGSSPRSVSGRPLRWRL